MKMIKVKFSKLSNPLLTYTSVWLAALFLTSLKMTTNLPDFNISTVFLIGSNIVSFWVIYYIVFSPAKDIFPKHFFINLSSVEKLKNFSNLLFNLWLAGTIIEILLGGGFPLAWVLLGIPKNYTEFGIPTFHGLLNGIYFFWITAYFLYYFVTDDKSILKKSFLGLLWPLCMLGRGIFLGAVFQIVFVYLQVKPLSSRKIVLLLSVMYIIVFMFGFIGDTRQTGNPFNYLVDPRYKQLFESLPSGFLWVYIYVTSPMSNLIVNIETINPSFAPIQTLSALLPSVLRDKFTTGVEDPFELIDTNLNVSTFYSNFLSDYGVFGAFLLIAVLQLIITLLYFNVRKGRVQFMIAYSVVSQCIIFSVFVNLFLLQTYIIQIVVSVYCSRFIDSENII
jgi:oligosaccharide repeat unit polymerase